MSETYTTTCPRCGQPVTLDVAELGLVTEGDRTTIRRMVSGTHECHVAVSIATTGSAKSAKVTDLHA